MDSGTSPARLDAAPSCRQPEGFAHRPHRGKRRGHGNSAPSEGSSGARLSPSTTFPVKPRGRSSALSPCRRVSWDQGTRRTCGTRSRAVIGTRRSKAPSLPDESRGCGDMAKRGTEAPSARGTTRGDPRPGPDQPPQPARSLHPSASRCATQRVRLSNDIIVPNVYRVCWDFTGDDKRAHHLTLEIHNRKPVLLPHFKNICCELMIQLIPTITGAGEKRLAEHPRRSPVATPVSAAMLLPPVDKIWHPHRPLSRSGRCP